MVKVLAIHPDGSVDYVEIESYNSWDLMKTYGQNYSLSYIGIKEPATKKFTFKRDGWGIKFTYNYTASYMKKLIVNSGYFSYHHKQLHPQCGHIFSHSKKCYGEEYTVDQVNPFCKLVMIANFGKTNHIRKDIFVGDCYITKRDEKSGEIIDVSKDDYDQIYKLLGGK
jgi:hypothetical protein